MQGPGTIANVPFLIVSGPTGEPVGLFLYQPGTSPALGNPPVISVTESPDDPFGNPVQSGVVVATTTGGFIQINTSSGQAFLVLWPSAATHVTLPPQIFGSAIGAGMPNESETLSLNSGGAGHDAMAYVMTSNSADNSTFGTHHFFAGNTLLLAADINAVIASVLLQATSGAAVTGGLSADTLNVGSGAVTASNLGMNTFTLTVFSGTLIHNQLTATEGTEASPTLITTDNWVTVTSFGAGFQAGSPVPQYALMPFGVNAKPSVALRGQVLLTGATLADAVMFTVPYTFTRTQDYITPNNLGGAVLGQRIVRVAASGAIETVPTGVNTNFVILDGIIANTG